MRNLDVKEHCKKQIQKQLIIAASLYFEFIVLQTFFVSSVSH